LLKEVLSSGFGVRSKRVRTPKIRSAVAGKRVTPNIGRAMIQEKIREKAKELLEKKVVDVIIGFGEGILPLRATPLFVRSLEEADRLVWNSFCENNLSTYLHKLSQF